MVVGVRVDVGEERNIPDFAIFQNDRTRVSGLWTKENGKWVQCSESEYEAIAFVAHLLRSASDPQLVLSTIAEQVRKMHEGE
ncbi:hypothetical protein CMI37_12945 [Candidatus Pacearchaeota archaeon]|nr:hypothetical protein [Candidatus Pacearchaeota archaeon]|tara:strand:- start:3548 stop:3793 length:246 start_codon:yes stop_codon:yes gene_type:complete